MAQTSSFSGHSCNISAADSGSRASASSSFYVRAAKELWTDRKNFALLLTTASCQAVAHGVLALCAAAAAHGLASPDVSRDGAPSWLATSTFTVCLIAFAAAVVKTGAGAASAYAQRRLSARVGARVRSRVASALLRGHATRAYSDTVAALSVRIRDLERGVSEGFVGSVRATLQLVPLCAALVAISPTLAAFAAFVLVPFAWALRLARRRFRRGHGRASHSAERLQVEVDELVRHADLWRTFGAQPRVRARLADAERSAAQAGARVDATQTAMSGANEALAALALVAMLLLVQAGWGGSIEGVLPFALVFFLIYRPLRALGDARAARDVGAEAWRALDSMTGGASDAPKPRTAPRRTWAEGTLRLRGLKPIRSAEALDLEVGPGQIVAVVGPTGAGKTTLLRTLLGLDRAEEGTIEYAGIDVTRAGVGPGERPFAWVPQDAMLITGTLEDNVRLALPDGASSLVAEQALRDVGASRLLEEPFEQALAAGARELSGGERKWVALARAMASGCPVVLMDEPTSGLDAEAERAVLEAIDALRPGRIFIIVTHQQGPVGLADHVVQL